MAMLDMEINVQDRQPGSGNFDPLPPGWYDATISISELRPTNDGTGKYIYVQYDITGPTHQGRVVFGRMNIQNKSPAAEKIGRENVMDIASAIGIPRVTDSDQLIGGRLSIKLSISPARTDQNTGKTYDASNDVKGYKSINGSAPPAPVAQGFAKPAAPATSKDVAPWLMKK